MGEKKATRAAYGEALVELAEKYPNMVVLDADLTQATMTKFFAAKYPERFFNCGIAEANMVGIASGMAAVGFKPIIHSFGPFVSRRVFDQVFLSAGYARNAITVIGSDPGVTAAYNGGTHMPFEDLAMYRAIPEATVFDIADPNMLESVLEQCVDMPGVKYVRTPRKQAATLYERGTKMPIGKAITLREGTDAVVFASGIMVHEAMQAAIALEKEGISVMVVNIFTVKPIDVEGVLAACEGKKAVVTAENHNRYGGLYSSICEVIAGKVTVPVGRVAVEDRFGEVGTMQYLQGVFGLTSDHIISEIKNLLK